jgi:hypothetical protein
MLACGCGTILLSLPVNEDTGKHLGVSMFGYVNDGYKYMNSLSDTEWMQHLVWKTLSRNHPTHRLKK